EVRYALASLSPDSIGLLPPLRDPFASAAGTPRRHQAHDRGPRASIRTPGDACGDRSRGRAVLAAHPPAVVADPLSRVLDLGGRAPRAAVAASYLGSGRKGGKGRKAGKGRLFLRRPRSHHVEFASTISLDQRCRKVSDIFLQIDGRTIGVEHDVADLVRIKKT